MEVHKALPFLLCVGCAGRIDVSRTVAPSEARSNLTAVAVVRGAERIELPAGAHVARGEVVLARGTVATVTMEPGAALVQDELGRIVGVRDARARVTTRFVPGTAKSSAGGVQAEIASIALDATDRVEVQGRFASGETVPGGDRVETSRWTGGIVAGLTLFTLAYAPSVWVGAQSAGDRALLWPVAGPWLDLVKRPACVPPQLPTAIAAIGVDACIGDTALRVALVVDGVAQGLGVLFTLLGIPAHAEIRTSHARISLVPTGTGAAAIGTF